MSFTRSGNTANAEVLNTEELTNSFIVVGCLPHLNHAQDSVFSVSIAACSKRTSNQRPLCVNFGSSVPVDTGNVTLSHVATVCTTCRCLIHTFDKVASTHWRSALAKV